MGSWVLVAFFTAPVCALAALIKLASNPHFSPLAHVWTGLRRRMNRLRGAVEMTPPGRPIQDIAFDVRRLGRQLNHADDGRSALRIAAIRSAYDDVLGEGCQALGIAHLLGVLPPSGELDAERQRVERVLEAAGMVLEQTP